MCCAGRDVIALRAEGVDGTGCFAGLLSAVLARFRPVGDAQVVRNRREGESRSYAEPKTALGM